MCQAQQQVLGTRYERDGAGHLDYGIHRLGVDIYAQVFYPHVAWNWKRVELPGQGSRGKRSEASEGARGRGRGKSSGCFLIVVGG